MGVAGYVLAGGNSMRMGTDKALLPIDGRALVQHIAATLHGVTATVHLIGDPRKYGGLGIPVIADLRPGNGPLAGIEAALLHSASEWNLIVACDMASLEPGFLSELGPRAVQLRDEIDCLVPASPDGRLQPFCALYRRRCATAISAALDAGIRKVTDVVNRLNLKTWQAPSAEVFQNINTPEDWNRYLNGRTQQH